MAVIKNKTTEANRAFWSHVETIAEQVRSNPDCASSRTASAVHALTFDHAATETRIAQSDKSEEED